jgi:2,4-dienoyl-CoA reductase-like NADH-dependent reductase (Old Yellow Enzyme family)
MCAVDAEMMRGEGSLPENNLAPLLAGLECGDFDVAAVGRALIANPDWPRRVRNGTPLALQPQHASDPRLTFFSR